MLPRGAERFAVAPMLDVTDGVFRRLMRLCSAQAVLYTEMVAAEAICHGRTDLLDFTAVEHPLVLQLGGASPASLARAAKAGLAHGYDEINLNAGCPSPKVQSGSFGACLMKEPRLLASLVQAMADATGEGVSVKTRIGVDELDSPEFTHELVQTLYAAGVRKLILHARKAWLHGLSPRENRSVPPLDYERVYAIKEAFPDLEIILNGGLTSLEACQSVLTRVDGVMLGRAVVDNPWLMSRVDALFYGASAGAPSSAADEEAEFARFAEKVLALGAELEGEGVPLSRLTRHVLGISCGRRGAKIFRRRLSTNVQRLTLRDLEAAIRDLLAA